MVFHKCHDIGSWHHKARGHKDQEAHVQLPQQMELKISFNSQSDSIATSFVFIGLRGIL